MKKKERKKMTIKYKGTSGRVVTDEELEKIFKEKHPTASDVAFDIWLYMGIECGAIKVIKS
jgi:hypothetical protein